MNDFDLADKKIIDEWREGAARVPQSMRRRIVDMKKAGKSTREIVFALYEESRYICIPTVSVIVIEEFAEERGELPVFRV